MQGLCFPQIETSSSLWDSLLELQQSRPHESCRNNDNLDLSQEFKADKDFPLTLFAKHSEQIPIEVASLGAYHENPNISDSQEKKDNKLQTQQLYVKETDSSMVEQPSKQPQIHSQKVATLQNFKKDCTFDEDNEFSSVFKTRRIRGQWKKNTNVPKFLARIFMKYFGSHVDQHTPKEAIAHHKAIRKVLLSRPSNNYSISDVISLLRDQSDPSGEVTLANQKIMAEIIKSTMQSQVIDNKYIKDNHMSYMMAIKLYAIRCRARSLTERVKIF